MEALQGHSAVGFDLGKDKTGVVMGPIAVLWGPRRRLLCDIGLSDFLNDGSACGSGMEQAAEEPCRACSSSSCNCCHFSLSVPKLFIVSTWL